MLAQKCRSGSVIMKRVALLSQGLVNGFKWAPTFVCDSPHLSRSYRTCFHRLDPCNLTPWLRDLRVCVGLCFTMSEKHVFRLGARFQDRKTSQGFKGIPVIDVPASPLSASHHLSIRRCFPLAPAEEKRQLQT